MKGLSGRVTRGLPTESKMNCVDNSGAKIVQLISVLKIGGTARRYPSAGVGDMINVTVRRGTPERRRQIFRAVVVRQRRPFRRADGTWVQFEDNACVLVSNDRGELVGTDIKGPISREAAERWPRIAATAKQIV
jgi:large subunit ribosomal protein L14